MAYADYEYYRDTYKGTLSETAYERLSERASDYIDSRTGYILKKAGITEEMEERVKKACCALSEVMSSVETGSSVKASESVGDMSVSYAVGTQRSDVQKLDDAIQLYLADLVKAVKWL